MIKTFYIYEIVGRKVGATIQPETRNRENFNTWQIMPILIETMEGPDTPEFWQIVGDREWELADLKGYTRGTHYKDARENRLRGCALGGSIGGRKHIESGHIFNMRTFKGSSKGGKASRTFTMEEAEEIRKEYAIGNTSLYRLAKKYNSNHNTIGRIIRRQSYNEA